jgi:hypothetical protein
MNAWRSGGLWRILCKGSALRGLVYCECVATSRLRNFGTTGIMYIHNHITNLKSCIFCDIKNTSSLSGCRKPCTEVIQNCELWYVEPSNSNQCSCCYSMLFPKIRRRYRSSSSLVAASRKDTYSKFSEDGSRYCGRNHIW